MADAAGQRVVDIELHVMAFAFTVTRSRAHRTRQLADMLGATNETVAESPYLLVGCPGEIADDLRRYRERWGINYYTVMANTMEAFAPVVAELART